ncbi:hypothetical protein ACP4OV_014092 [Aristida adscensionis]
METLTEVVRSTKQFKIQGFSLTCAMANGEAIKLRRWNVGGYDWEIQVLPNRKSPYTNYSYIALDLYFRSEAPANPNVKAKFSCHIIDPNGKLKPYPGDTVSANFKRDACYRSVFLMTRWSLRDSGYLKDDALTIACTIEVLRVLSDKPHRAANDLAPSSSLNHHLGDLLQKGTGVDVTLVVSGEPFPAHKAILASRSPVFMAQFFGDMSEKHSQIVEIKEMEPSAFRAMLHFIYTDSAPELDRPEEDGTTMAIAQHLLAAADRYGIDRLKLICEDKLYDGIGVLTAATTLALAEQHYCSCLKAKCLEFIATNLEAVMATDGYKHLMAASCPSVMNDILKAVHGRKS